MANVRYSVVAIQDLEAIGDYIVETLKNPMAALNTVSKIQRVVAGLADFPLIGSPLSAIAQTETDYRFLVCGNYLAFYHVQGDDAFIDRILYGRRDYLTILFGDITDSEQETAE